MKNMKTPNMPVKNTLIQFTGVGIVNILTVIDINKNKISKLKKTNDSIFSKLNLFKTFGSQKGNKNSPISKVFKF